MTQISQQIEQFYNGLWMLPTEYFVFCILGLMAALILGTLVSFQLLLTLMDVVGTIVGVMCQALFEMTLRSFGLTRSLIRRAWQKLRRK